MRIVNLSYTYFPIVDPEQWIDGYWFFYGIWEELAGRHEVSYLHLTQFNKIITRNGLTHRFIKTSIASLRLPYALHLKMRTLRPDVVVVHSLRSPVQVILLRLQLGRQVKIVVQHHAEVPPRHPLKRAAQRLADRCVDAYFFTGRSHADPWLAGGLISEPAKLREVMEVSSVFKPMDMDQARAELHIGASPVYLWVGHLNANKDPMLALRAFLRFIANGSSGACMYFIFQSEGLLSEMKRILADAPWAEEQVRLVGRVPHDDLQPWFSAADFIISSSHYEGSGVAVCEGMSCGCVPILSDIPSFRFMTGGACGLLYEPGNEEALFRALHDSARMDLAAERQKTLEQFERELSFRAIADRIQSVLSAL